MDELLVLHQFLGMRAANIDVIAKDVIMLDLQRGDSRGLAILVLQRRDQAAAFVAERAKLVKRRVEAGPHKAAITCQQRQFIGKRRRQLRRQTHRCHHTVMKRRERGQIADPVRPRRCSDHIRRHGQRL